MRSRETLCVGACAKRTQGPSTARDSSRRTNHASLGMTRWGIRMRSGYRVFSGRFFSPPQRCHLERSRSSAGRTSGGVERPWVSVRARAKHKVPRLRVILRVATNHSSLGMTRWGIRMRSGYKVFSGRFFVITPEVSSRAQRLVRGADVRRSRKTLCVDACAKTNTRSLDYA